MSQMHGHCSAIFSLDKENEARNDTPTERRSFIYCSTLNKPRRSLSQSPARRDRNAPQTYLKHENTLSTPNLSMCAARMPQKNSQYFKKASSDENSKAIIRHGLSHTQPPRHVQNFRTSVTSTPKSGVKKYFTDNPFPQTPECYSAVQMETPKAKENGFEEQTIYEGESSNLTVGIRIRPLNSKELNESNVTSVITTNGQTVTVEYETMQHTFTYDHCFASYSGPNVPNNASQQSIFTTMVLPLVENSFEGYNVCLFAYGQTGSGKSYSMMGTDPVKEKNEGLNSEAGIIPRFCHELFSRIHGNKEVTSSVEISYFEIYNEKIHDLLVSNGNANNKKPCLRVREHPSFGPYIVDLSQHVVQNYEDLKTWLKVGNSQRATAATGMNEKSSRSHSIFSIILTQTEPEKLRNGEAKDAVKRSKINLVDLAGSERYSQTAVSGERLREGVSINKSLLTLGKVISSLSENVSNRKQGFVPYRESVLTWLLKESLGGNSKTAMLGTVSPANIHIEETLATMRYACQARAIVNRVHVNEDQHDRLIRSLKAQVTKLEGLKESYEKQLGLVPRRLLDFLEPTSNLTEIQEKQREINILKDQLKSMKAQLETSKKSWSQKLKEAEEKKDVELKYLRRCGIAIELDVRQQPQPCLVNLASDPMLSGTLFYLIPTGIVRIGKNPDSENLARSRQPDIVLDGPLVKRSHCIIENTDGTLFLHPGPDGDTYVNGKRICRRLRLNNGDRLVIGGSHYFKVIHPVEQCDTQPLTEPVEFEYAHQEVLRVQENELRAELEDSKKKAMKELENLKLEMEAQFNLKKSEYESEIKILGSTLQQQKIALDAINEKQKQMEKEKEILSREVETSKKMRDIEHASSQVDVDSYKSNFIEELEKLLNETTASAEFALMIKQSSDASENGSISLYQVQLLVNEASELCREVGLNYEFHQQQVVKDKKLQPFIRVRDKVRMKEILWDPVRFRDWMHRLRDHDVENSIKELQDSEEEWESYEENKIVYDSLDSSRISVNISPVKKQLSESIFQFSLDATALDVSISDFNCTGESLEIKRQNDMNQCLVQIEIAAKTLEKLCHQHQSVQVSGKVTETLNQIHRAIQSVRSTLTNNKNDSENNEVSLLDNETSEVPMESAENEETWHSEEKSETLPEGPDNCENRSVYKKKLEIDEGIVALSKKYFEEVEKNSTCKNTRFTSNDENASKCVRFNFE